MGKVRPGALAALLLACSASTSGGTEGAALVVNRATYVANVGPLQPASGNEYVDLNLTLQNTGGPRALSANLLLFSVETDAAITTQASPVSSQIANFCDPQTSVSSGGSYTCDLLFEISNAQTPSTLHYDDQLGATAYAPVPMIAPLITTVAGTKLGGLDWDITVSFLDLDESVVSYTFTTDDGEINDVDVPVDPPQQQGSFVIHYTACCANGSVNVHATVRSASGVDSDPYDAPFNYYN